MLTSTRVAEGQAELASHASRMTAYMTELTHIAALPKSQQGEALALMRRSMDALFAEADRTVLTLMEQAEDSTSIPRGGVHAPNFF